MRYFIGKVLNGDSRRYFVGKVLYRLYRDSIGKVLNGDYKVLYK